jgi:hypothetical protein
MLADTKEEVIEFLKKDVYVEAGVWDVANVSCFLPWSVLVMAFLC